MNLIQNHSQALFDIRRLLPQVVQDVLLQFPGRVFVAGGFLRAVLEYRRDNVIGAVWQHLKGTDIDLFVTDPALVDQIKEAFSRVPCWASIHPSERAVTYRTNCPDAIVVQLITGWTFPTLEQGLASFDFTICQLAYGVETTPGNPFRLWGTPAAFDHLTDELLVYTHPAGTSGPGNSLMRAFKLSRKGYYINPDDVAAILDDMADTLKPGERFKGQLRPAY